MKRCGLMKYINFYGLSMDFIDFFYRRETGGTKESDCTACDLGHYCNGTGKTGVTDICDPGYFCKRGAKMPKPNNDSTGGICPRGSFCKAGNQPEKCGPGTRTFLSNGDTEII